LTPIHEHDTVARTLEFEITTSLKDPFLVVTLRGRFTDDLLGVLRKQVLLQLRSMAFDVSALSGTTMALARELHSVAQGLRAKGHSFVFLNPPDSFRSYLKLLGADRRVPVLLLGSQLPAQAAETEEVAQKLEKELQLFRREMESNAFWQFTDREFCWVCPFCVDLCEEVQIASRNSVTQSAVEKVWRHLNCECRSYVPLLPRLRQKAELETKVREVNQLKLNASARSMEALQSKVSRLEEKAQWATDLERGVKIAASRQRRLLPTKAPDVAGCEIAYTYRSAEDLSGDFFDFVELGDGRTAFVIGDVSGHGIEAGILMGMTKKVLSIRLGEMGDPVAALKKANADIVKDMDRASFVTVAAMIYDPLKRTITSARAGHNPPLLYSPDRKDALRKFEGGGLMIGMAAPALFDASLVPEVVEIRMGDVLLLYTDGLEEGKNPAEEEFGLARIVKVLQEECAKPAAYLLGALFYEFDRFSNGIAQEDDLTAVCVKFK
jgi:serine phosphatase RsbU (regulator of sigma subunit)